MKIFITNGNDLENFDGASINNSEAVGFFADLTIKTETITYYSEEVQVSYCYIEVGGLLESAQYTTYAGTIIILENALAKIGFHWINGDTTCCLLPYKMSQDQAFSYIVEPLCRYGWFINLR